MANQPGKNTVTVSMTMPRQLKTMAEQRALSELTNLSDIVRRALMNYLTPEERSLVVMEQSGKGNIQQAFSSASDAPASKPAKARSRGKKGKKK